jgi:hypothetical protein
MSWRKRAVTLFIVFAILGVGGAILARMGVGWLDPADKIASVVSAVFAIIAAVLVKAPPQDQGKVPTQDRNASHGNILINVWGNSGKSKVHVDLRRGSNAALSLVLIALAVPVVAMPFALNNVGRKPSPQPYSQTGPSPSQVASPPPGAASPSPRRPSPSPRVRRTSAAHSYERPTLIYRNGAQGWDPFGDIKENNFAVIDTIRVPDCASPDSSLGTQLRAKGPDFMFEIDAAIAKDAPADIKATFSLQTAGGASPGTVHTSELHRGDVTTLRIPVESDQIVSLFVNRTASDCRGKHILWHDIRMTSRA